jgi:dipeptidyl aminopeptidase/acylaminoacyl peptidase
MAYVGREIGPLLPSHHIPEQVVWLAAGSAPPSAVWRAPAGEALTDVSWSPDGQRLVAASAQELSGGDVRSRLWLIEPAARTTRLLFTLPSRVVPGSLVWSPDGRRMALLAHAGVLNALCLVDLEGEFRYLADLEPSLTEPLPYPPLTWSADGQQAVFAAPRQEPLGPPATWLQPEVRRGLYLVDATPGAPRLIGDAEAALGAWREDGQLMTLVRSRDGTLAVGVIDAQLHVDRLIDIPLKPASVYAAEWDTAHARLQVASRSMGEVEYWLVRLGLADQP